MRGLILNDAQGAVRMNGTETPAWVQEAAHNVVNAFIVGAIAFFSTLPALGLPLGAVHVQSAAIAFGLAFFSQWAYERGVKQVRRADSGPPE